MSPQKPPSLPREGGLLAFANGDFIVGMMGRAIHITNYLAFIDTLNKDSPIEERLEAAEKWMDEQNAGTIFFPKRYIEARNGNLTFYSTVFAGDLEFEFSSSLKIFKLQNCRVTGNIFFDGLEGVISFEIIKNTKVDGKLSIQKSLESLEISDSKIGGSIELGKDSTIGTLRIRDCEAKNISMRGVTINDTTYLRGIIATLPKGGLSFDATGAKFGGPVYCSDTHFNGKANFTNAEFSEQAGFASAVFHHIAEFHTAKFSKGADFSNTTFCHAATFTLAKFSSFANFSQATFSDSASFFRACFQDPVVFSHATFEKRTKWIAAEFKKNVTFNKVTFCYPPNFRSTTFHVSPDLHALEITKPYELPDNTKDYTDDDTDDETQLPPIYRHLKKLSVEANNHGGFLDHGAREVRANCLSKSIFKAMIPALYLGLSDSGRSISRPVLWLLGVIIAGAWYYTSAGVVNLGFLLIASIVIPSFLFWMLLLYCKPTLPDSLLVDAVGFWGSIIMLLVGVYLGIIFLFKPDEALRALATSVMATLSITQLFRLLPGGIYEAMPCGMMALTPENMDFCLTTERGEFLAMDSNKNIRFIPGAYIVSGVQILISSVLLFLFGLGIRNRIKTG